MIINMLKRLQIGKECGFLDEDVSGKLDDGGLPAYSHQSYYHQVGICHNDEGWEYDTVTFPPRISVIYIKMIVLREKKVQLILGKKV